MMKNLAVILVAVLVGGATATVLAETWNVGDDFSPVENPAGAWSYGWRDQPAQPLNLYVNHAGVDEWGTCALDVWSRYPGAYTPNVWHNPHDYTLWCGPNESTENPPNAVSFHPGTSSQSVIRWTAPADMTVALAAVFTEIDGGSSSVFVYHNGVCLFHADIAGYDDMVTFTPELPVEAGDVLDCAVDAISYVYDTVRVDITIVTDSVEARSMTWGAVKSLY